MVKKIILIVFLAMGIPLSASTSFITEIIDGDTVWVTYLGTNEKVRILGIDTPEKDECLYTEAKNYTSSLFTETHEVVIISDQRRDQYGRLLAYIQLPDGRDVGELLIDAGLATYYRNDTYSNKELYSATEQKAQNANRGIWDSKNCSDETFISGSSSDETIPPSFLSLLITLIKTVYAALGLN